MDHAFPFDVESQAGSRFKGCYAFILNAKVCRFRTGGEDDAKARHGTGMNDIDESSSSQFECLR